MLMIVLVITFVVIFVILAGGILYLYNSPMPGVFLLRRAFRDDGAVHNPPDYEEKKANILIKKDLNYPSKDGRNQYDLYLPKNSKHRLPVIIWIHGGAFVAGEKSGVENWAVMLANEGYAVVAVDYQWAPEIKYPGQVRQIEECITELQNKEKEGMPLDMSNVILAGDSAGAHIAAQAALLATNPLYEKELGVASALKKENLKTILLYCGPYNVEQILTVEKPLLQFFTSRIGWAMLGDKHWQKGEAISTTTIKNYVTSEFPPAYIADGNSGSFEKEGKELVAELKKNGVKVQSLFFDKEKKEVGHEYQFDLSSEEGMQTYQETVCFLEDNSVK